MARFLAAVGLGILLWIGALQQDASHRAEGRQAYLTKEAARFDRLVSRRHVPLKTCITAVTFVGGAVGIYELCAAAIYWAIRPRTKAGAA
jgi:hypothetical protein